MSARCAAVLSLHFAKSNPRALPIRGAPRDLLLQFVKTPNKEKGTTCFQVEQFSPDGSFDVEKQQMRSLGIRTRLNKGGR